MCLTTDKDRGLCRQTNIVYEIQCRPCQAQGSQVHYWGETARSAFERGSEHRKDLEHMRGGHMETHLIEKHPNICLADPKNRQAETNFTFKIHQKHKSALDRQLGEAITIARHGGMGSDQVMNRKDEFSRCLIPEIEMKDRNTQIGQKKNEHKRSREPENDENEENVRYAKKHKITPQDPTPDAKKHKITP